MSTLLPGRPPAHPPQLGRVWRLRAFLLAFLCLLFLSSNIFTGWIAPPAHAAPVSHPNPPLKVPAALQPPTAVKPPDLGVYVHGKQNTTLVPISHAVPQLAPALSVTLTTQAQQLFSRDGTLEIDLASGTVSAAQIKSAGGTIHLILTQTDGVSGGDASGRLFLGTYQVSLQDAQGMPLTTLTLAHPLTFRYHASPAQQSWFWQNQPLQALWQISPTPTASANKAATTTPTPTPSSRLQLAQKDTNAAVWSVSSDLSTLGGTTTSATHTATATTTPTTLTPAVAASSITFSTEAPTASWGKARDVDVGLSSGSLDYGYPLNIPPGPGGLTPALNLTYSSGSVNESHNVQAAAPWVGEGWNLSLGSISWSQENVTPGGTNKLENVWNISDPSGLNGQLIPPDVNAATSSPTTPAMNALPAQYIWHTAPESHAKVQEVNFNGQPCWHVWLPNGNMEEFGCVDEARQSAIDANGNNNPYRWDLDLIVDRYGNQVRIHYQRVSASKGIRDAQISSIEYDDPSCHSTSFNGATAQCGSWNPKIKLVFDAATKPANLTNATGCQNWTSTSFRCDDPVDLSGSGGLTIANALNTFVLNDLKVQVNGNVLREYVFSYDQGGPQTITDPFSGQHQSVSGYLNLTKIQQLGTNGTTLNAPITTMSYTNQTQHYLDIWSGRDSSPGTNCGPSWTPHDPSVSGTPCFRWEQSYNSYYLNSIDNGMGWNATMTWKEAHANTHGVDSGAANNPFTCNGAQQSTNLCGSADDKSWSRIVLTQRSEQTNGVTSTWNYQYYLNGLTAPQCTNCNWGDTWGNQNDTDFADFYNGIFTSFASAVVTNPDNSSQTNYFASTPGWGIAENSITCFLPGGSCNIVPYWNQDPGMAGSLKTEQDFSASGALMQVTNNSYSMNCPPTGVSHSGNASGPPFNPGNQYLISELDQNNPVVVCDPRITQEDTYQVDGVTNLNGYQSDARVIHKTVSKSYDGSNQGVSAYDYGNVNTVDTTSNDVGGSHFVQSTSYSPNDNIGSNIYLTDLPSFASSQDGSGTFFGCTAYVYGSNSSAPQRPSIPAVTQQVGYPVFQSTCNDATISTRHTYDNSGNPITAIDPDGHLGCTNGSAQYSACASYDSFDTHLMSALNAKNQTVSYQYDASSANGGFGQWLLSSTDANGQVTSYSYDALGRLTSVIQPGDTQSQPTISYTYTNTCTTGSTAPCLELDTTRLTNGFDSKTTSKQWFDGMGRLVETQAPNPHRNPNFPRIGSLLITYTVYDNMGRATTQSIPYMIPIVPGTYAAPDLSSARTVTSYDSLGRTLGTVSYGTGSTILSVSTVSYTVAQGIPSFNVDTTTPFEQTITSDAYQHRQVTYTDALGRDRYEQVFTGTGSPYSVVRTVQYNRDTVGNIVSVITYDNTSASLARYNAAFDGLQRRIGYNDWDQGDCNLSPMPASCSSSSDTAHKYSYDADGNVLSQTDPRNITTYTSYDALNRPLCYGTASTQVNPCQNSAYATYFYDSYDASSNSGVTFPTGCTAPSGTSTPIGRMIAETFSGAAGSGWRCFGYDNRGQTTSSTLSVTADTQTTTQNVSMTYNEVGAVTSLTYPNGEALTSIYDNDGYLRSVYFGTSGSTPITFLASQVNYNGSGLLSGLGLGGSGSSTSVPPPILSTTLGYDDILRLVSTSATLAGSSSSFWNESRTYDNAGNVLQLTTTVPTTTGGSVTENQAFCYDALDRLVWAGNSGTPTGGDHCGPTPTGSTTPNYAQPFSYDASDRLTSGSAGTVSYNDPSHVHAATNLSSIPNQYASYDAMGNMTCRTTDTSGSQSCDSATQTGATMSYDNEGRLASWTAPTGLNSSTQYLYDNSGNRVLQRSSTTPVGSTTATVTDTITFDGYTDVTITNGTSTITNYYSVAGQRVAMRQGNTFSYLLPDFLGSSSVALKFDGSVQAVQLFAPYGSTRYSDGTMPGPFSFTGQRLDPQSGLLYYNARYYDPVAGRFTSADTVQNNTTGSDPYAYVGDSPETKVDPTGNRHICGDGPDGSCSDDGGDGSSAPAPSPAPAPPPPPPPAPSTDNSGGGGGGWGGFWGNVASSVGHAASAALDAVTGIPSMVHDVQTVFDSNKSWGERALAFGDFALNAGMDISMLTGVGEAARGLYLAAHVAGDLIEHAGADVAEHAVADTAEHAASDATEHTATTCGGGLSFVASTSVATIVGARAIGSLHPGDKVWAYNPTTKHMELEPILHVWINHDNDLVDLTITKTSHDKGAKPTSEVIHTNQKHPFLTVEKGFLPVGQITLGIHIVEADGHVGIVSGWKVVPGAMTMYNLEVAQDHTFAVGVGEWVVHNCGSVNSGDAGAYKNLLGEKGDGLTPHHMPQGSLAQHFGFNYREGGAIVMDQPTHQLTYNYGGLANGTKSAIINGGYTFRQALAASIRDYRSLVPNSNSSVRQLIEYWNNAYPQLMQK